MAVSGAGAVAVAVAVVGDERWIESGWGRMDQGGNSAALICAK